MAFYLISFNTDKFIVEADTSVKAVIAWGDMMDKEEKEYYKSKRKFRPSEFSVESIGTYHGIIKSSQ